MEIHGRGYVVDHCVAAYMRDLEEARYRAYVTDALMSIAQNTCNFAGGSTMSGRWYQGGRPRDDRDGDEIVLDIVTKLGLTYKGGET